MSLEVRQHRLPKLDVELKNSAPPKGAALHVGSKRSACRVEKPSKKQWTPSESETLAIEVGELANTGSGIQALLSMPPIHHLNEGTRVCVSASPCPGMSWHPIFHDRNKTSHLLMASDSLDKDEHDYYAPLAETMCSHSQFQRQVKSHL